MEDADVKVLATGATGKYAGLVVSALLARGVEVRAVAHDPNKAGALHDQGIDDVVVVDLEDRNAIEVAARGVDGVFLITPAFHPRATQMALNAVAATIAAGVPKLVYNGVYHPSLSLPNHAGTRPVEESIYASNLDFTVLQPAMYVQALGDTFRAALASGAVVAPWSKEAKMSYVDYRDVAETAALAFVEDRLSHGTFELAAGGMIDRTEVAALMSHASGCALHAADLPEDARGGAGESAGLQQMFDDYHRNGFHGGNPLILQTILGRPPRSVAAFIRELGNSVPTS